MRLGRPVVTTVIGVVVVAVLSIVVVVVARIRHTAPLSSRRWTRAYGEESLPACRTPRPAGDTEIL
jgi:hypothetical protein